MSAWLPFLVAAMLQTAGPAGPPPAGTKAAMNTEVQTLAKGGDSAVEEARQVTARTDAEWTKVWRAHSFEDALPKVDFTRHMVVGVFLGTRPTAGFGVDIVETRVEKGVLVVRYRETKPGRDRMTAQILTAPYHLAAIPRFNGDVKFEAIEP